MIATHYLLITQHIVRMENSENSTTLQENTPGLQTNTSVLILPSKDQDNKPNKRKKPIKIEKHVWKNFVDHKNDNNLEITKADLKKFLNDNIGKANGQAVNLTAIIMISFTLILLSAICSITMRDKTRRTTSSQLPITIMLLSLATTTFAYAPFLKKPFVFNHKGEFNLNIAHINTVNAYVPCDLLTIKNFLNSTVTKNGQLCRNKAEEHKRKTAEFEELVKASEGNFYLMSGKYTRFQGELLCKAHGGSLPEIRDPATQSPQLYKLMQHANVLLVPAGIYFSGAGTGRYHYSDGTDVAGNPFNETYINNNYGISWLRYSGTTDWNDISYYFNYDTRLHTSYYQTLYMTSAISNKPVELIQPLLLRNDFAHESNNAKSNEDGDPIIETYTVICQNISTISNKNDIGKSKCEQAVEKQKLQLHQFQQEMYSVLPISLPSKTLDITELMPDGDNTNSSKSNNAIEEEFLKTLTLRATSPLEDIKRTYISDLINICTQRGTKLNENKQKRSITTAFQVGVGIASIAYGIYEYMNQRAPSYTKNFGLRNIRMDTPDSEIIWKICSD